jgi:hypothetical protein
MADDTTPRYYRNASPGISGAIKDAVDAVAKTFGPKSITQRGAKIDEAVDSADDDGSHSSEVPSTTGRVGQSTDSYNKY